MNQELINKMNAVNEQEVKRLRVLVTAAEQVLASAEHDRKTASQLLAKLDKVERRVDSALGQIPEAMARSLSSLADATADRMAKRFTNNFDAAGVAATQAAIQYRKAGKYLHRKFWISTCLFQIVVAAIVLGAIQLFVPDKEEIASRRQEVAVLNQHITALEQRGAKMQIRTCNGRLCVRIDPSAIGYTSDEGTYRVVY